MSSLSVEEKEAMMLEALRDTRITSLEKLAKKIKVSTTTAGVWVTECSYLVAARLHENKHRKYQVMADKVAEFLNQGYGIEKARKAAGVSNHTYFNHVKELL